VRLVATVALAGCGAISGDPPETMRELRTGAGGYGREEVATHNLLRVVDGTLTDDERIGSLSVVVHLAGTDPAYLSQLASLLELSSTSPAVHRAVLGVLARRDYPGVDPHVQAALPRARSDAERRTLLDWAARHRRPETLSAVVRLWARANPSDAATEDRFRRAVESIAGRTWSEALLEGLNRPLFKGRRSALYVLTARLSRPELARRIQSVDARVIATEALQYCLREADYLPDAADLLAVVEAYAGRRPQLDAAIAVSRQWGEACGYRFTIGDMHLLAGLAAGDLQRPDRADLLATVGERLRRRNRRADAAALRASGLDATPLERLSTASLVRVRLLGEMMDDSQARRGIAVAMGGADRWGGLVFLQEGRARPRLYQSTGDDGGGYQPSDMMVQDARCCLAHIHGGAAAGPTAGDVARAQRLGAPGLVVAQTAGGQLAAVYYEDDDVVVPLGVFDPRP